MVKKVSKRLVIDASVARAAGDKDAPTSQNCRDFLTAVKDICHQLVMTPEIKKEWDKHQSTFTQRWRSSMVAKKKLVYQDIAVDNDLWNLIKKYSETEKQQKAMEKDLLLIEAAIATDKIVVSLDETVKELFAKATAEIEVLKQVAWVNPDVGEEEAIAWLKNGADIESKYLLGWQEESNN
ncbi:MAG: hypothetical protein SXA11_16275 [Cyanobacteriota bacterium]|nr:hypothetical protein [Cyanobacteriota bacterium]